MSTLGRPLIKAGEAVGGAGKALGGLGLQGQCAVDGSQNTEGPPAVLHPPTHTVFRVLGRKGGSQEISFPAFSAH